MTAAVPLVVGFWAATADAQGGPQGRAQNRPQGAVQWRGEGGWGPGASYARRYDPKSVETASGEVVSVDNIAPMRGMSHGVHLLVRTENETISVHLGPAWYIENQEVKLEPGDRIVVKGSRITLDGTAALVAAEVTKGDRVLTLRDGNGFPAWSGWRRR